MAGAFWLLVAGSACPPSGAPRSGRSPPLAARRVPGPSRLPPPKTEPGLHAWWAHGPRGLPSSARRASAVGQRARTRQRPGQGPRATSSLSYTNSLSLERDRVFTLMRKAWKEGEMSPCPECSTECTDSGVRLATTPSASSLRGRFCDCGFCRSLWSVWAPHFAAAPHIPGWEL